MVLPFRDKFLEKNIGAGIVVDLISIGIPLD
jgi:hypothetical protein